jgi:HAD superfamily hydrolase (TIGR01509 family)
MLWIYIYIIISKFYAALFVTFNRKSKKREEEAGTSMVAVLFDFDGTVGDTETPAMQVAYWEICPYLVGVTAAAAEAGVSEYVRNNAGKAFEFMVDACNKERASAGLSATCEEVWQRKEEDPDLVAVVDQHRATFGLPPLRSTSFESLVMQQKMETVDALSKVARPCNGIPETLANLSERRIKFCIATTSPKPRVPASITACGLDQYFPPEKVHSGESDFTPPKFKPAPDVYLKAAAGEGMDPADCVAVEDSGSGVGSAANAGVGLIVGYVGASHISHDKADSHAQMLMSGSRSLDGRGAEIVISDMKDLLKIVDAFADQDRMSFSFPEALVQSLQRPLWIHGKSLK